MLSTTLRGAPRMHLNLTCRRVTDDLSDRSLCGSTFARAELFGACFAGTDLTGASFFEADAVAAVFDRAVLAHARLWGAQFTATSFRRADCREASAGRAVFHASDLSGADFRDADLTSVHFNTCLLAGTDVRGADLSGATENQSMLEGLIIDESTVLPEKWVHRLFPDTGTCNRMRQILAAGWDGPIGDLLDLAADPDVLASIEEHTRPGRRPAEWDLAIQDHLDHSA